MERGETLRRALMGAPLSDVGGRPHGPRHKAGRPLLGAHCTVEVWQLDLALMSSVKAFAERWEKTQRPLHVLINNAGIYSMSSEYVP